MCGDPLSRGRFPLWTEEGAPHRLERREARQGGSGVRGGGPAPARAGPQPLKHRQVPPRLCRAGWLARGWGMASQGPLHTHPLLGLSKGSELLCLLAALDCFVFPVENEGLRRPFLFYLPSLAAGSVSVLLLTWPQAPPLP